MTYTRRIVIVALVTSASLASASHALAQAAQGDHWKFMPPLATACFTEDGFTEKLGAARNTINAEIEKQDKINAAAKEKFDNMDMMEKAQRMQAFMMKNPQAAAKMLQGQQQAADAATGAVSEGSESARGLTAELERLKTAFRGALDAAVKPVQDKQAALIKAKTVLVGEVQAPMFTNAADYGQYVQLIAEENAAIEKACAPFFGANGSFHKWIASWRAEVTEKTIVAGASADVVVMQMEAMDLPGGGYRSTNPLQQVGNHVHQVVQVYGVRPSRVQPTVGLKK